MNTVLDRSVSFDDSVLCSGGRVVDFTQNNLQKSKLFANSLQLVFLQKGSKLIASEFFFVFLQKVWCSYKRG